MFDIEDLNPEQLQAVKTKHGPVAIIAGPGTGKTKTLVARIKYLIQSGIKSKQILALTFTKKAAAEMQIRLGNRKVKVLTFHGLCFEILKNKSGQTPKFITEVDRLALIKKLAKNPDLKIYSNRELSLMISKVKNGLDGTEATQNLVRAYNQELRKQNLNDFDDLLVEVKQLLDSDKQFRNKIQHEFSHILVDEFQDTNPLQYDILNLIRGNDNLFVIGDPLQSIYGFRGASVDIFDRFKQDFLQAKIIVLSTNYRSSPEIVKISNSLFVDAPYLIAKQTEPGRVCAVQVLNEYSEAAYVVDQIEQAIGGTNFIQSHSRILSSRPNVGFNHFAVLYRNHAVAKNIKRSLDESGIPYQLVGEESPYERPKIKMVLQILKAIATGNQTDVKDLSQTQLASMLSQLPNSSKPSDLAASIVDFCKFDPKDFTQLNNTLVAFSDLPAFVDYVESISDQGFYDPNVEAVTLSTIHASKGLEFGHVFLIAVEEGTLPSSRRDNIAEEKRLFYVAVTRPKSRLDILYTKFRNRQEMCASSFLNDIPESILPRIVDPNMIKDQKRVLKHKIKNAQGTLF